MTDSIATIKAALLDIQADDARLKVWQEDSRKGVQALLKAYRRRIEKQEKAEAAYQKRFAYEWGLWQAGYANIAGIDEVGRGPLAGPVVAAAVVLPHDFHEVAVNDSKQLSQTERERLEPLIKEEALAYGLGVVSPARIDEINIYEASREAMLQALNALEVRVDHLLVDAMVVETEIPQEKLIKGDAHSNSIAAASILAKVYRDRLMMAYDQQYPGYGFAHNDGYGTAEHLSAMAKKGITPIHRRSFAPVKKYC